MKKIWLVVLVLWLIIGSTGDYSQAQRSHDDTFNYQWNRNGDIIDLNDLAYSNLQKEVRELNVIEEAVTLLLEESLERASPAQSRSRFPGSHNAIIYTPPMYYEIQNVNGEWQTVSRKEYKEFEKKLEERFDKRIERMAILAKMLGEIQESD